MNTATKNRSFTSALKDFFGFRPGQNLKDFRDELSALTDADKLELHEGLAKVGIVCDPPMLRVSDAAAAANEPAAAAA